VLWAVVTLAGSEFAAVSNETSSLVTSSSDHEEARVGRILCQRATPRDHKEARVGNALG